jgi:hypothetical protein
MFLAVLSLKAERTSQLTLPRKMKKECLGGGNFTSVFVKLAENMYNELPVPKVTSCYSSLLA